MFSIFLHSICTSHNMLITFFIIFVIKLVKMEGGGKNTDILRATYPVYGLGSAIDVSGNSSVCFKELSEFISAVDSSKVWGLKVLDASGRPPSGFLYGNNFWLGSHVQCIDILNRKEFEIRNDKIDHMVTSFDYPPYELGFSVILLSHNSTMQWQMRMPFDGIVQLGLCIPKSCSVEDIFYLSNNYFSDYPLEFQKEYQVKLNTKSVRILKEDVLWLLKLPKTIILIIIMSTMLTLTVIGTIYDVRQHKREKKLIIGHNKIKSPKDFTGLGLGLEFAKSPLEPKAPKFIDDFFRCFSFYSNVKKWNNKKIEKGSLDIIHGLKFLSMLWVILVHTSFFERDFSENVPYAWRLTEDFFAQIVSNSTFCVDTYFFLSGFLLAYLFFKKCNHPEVIQQSHNCTGKIGQFFYVYVQRFFRFTPTYGLIILLSDVVYTLYNEKSALYYPEQPHVQCDKYWWRNLLYINNLFPRSEMCLEWSWYLSADMQFFAVVLFLLLLSTIYFNLAVCLIVLLIVIQIVTTAYTAYRIDYLPTLDDQLEHADALYDLPWIRMGPYLVGAVTGYILEVKLKNKLVLKRRTRILLWIIFPLLNLWILFTLYTKKVSKEFAAFYMAVSRPLWAVGIGWLVVATATGNARLLEKFLSYKAWIPLGRLTYCAYLLNPLIVTMIVLGSETPINATVSQMAISSMGTLFTTFLMSFLFTLLFESPFLVLRKLIFKMDFGESEKNFKQEIHSKQTENGVGNSSSTISTVA